MTNFFNTLIKIFNTHKLKFLGLILFSAYIWDRLIRIRLPRDIPFQLNLFTLIILLFICILYIYLLYRIFNPSQTLFILRSMLKYLLFIIEAFKTFDNYIKSLWFIRKWYDKFLLKNVNNKKEWYNYSFYTKIILICSFGPNLCLLFAFILDVFYFNKIQHFYYFIPLTIISLIIPYIIFSIQQYIESLIESIESKIDRIEVPFVSGVLPSEEEFDEEYEGPYISMYLKLRPFLKHYLKQMYLYTDSEEMKHYDYTVWLENECYEEISKRYDITTKLLPDHLWNLMVEPFKQCIKDITKLNFILKSYELTMYIGEDAVIHKMKYFKIILFSGYLICWLYILIKSLYNIDLTLLIKELMDVSRILDDPFSGIILGIPTLANTLVCTQISIFKQLRNKITRVFFQEDSDSFMKTSKQRHILAVSDEKGEYFYVLNPLTSAKGGLCFEISKEQFKVFQDKLNGNVSSEVDKEKSHNKKTQQLMEVCNIEILIKKDALIVKDSNTYFNTLNKKAFERIQDSFNIVKNSPYKWFNIEGITKKQCLQICDQFDYNKTNNINHPKSLHEEEAIQQAKNSQKEAHIKKKQEQFLENQKNYGHLKKNKTNTSK